DMQIDSYTVLLFGLAVKGLLGVLFLYFWFRDRQTPFGWWSATLLLGAATTAFFMLRGASALWVAACLVPGFLENEAARVVVSSLIIAPLLAMSGVEFWRGRDET